jgi:hypothetical protein
VKKSDLQLYEPFLGVILAMALLSPRILGPGRLFGLLSVYAAELRIAAVRARRMA